MGPLMTPIFSLLRMVCAPVCVKWSSPNIQGITEAEISDTGGLMRMTYGSNAFFGYLKPAGQPVYWFDSYAADESDIEKINNPAGYARDELVDCEGGSFAPRIGGNSVILAPAIRRLNHCRPVATPRERRTPRKAI